jgi:hypothetical protein
MSPQPFAKPDAPPHLHALRARDLTAFVGALDDAQPFVFGHGGHHRHEAAPHRRGEVDIAAIQNINHGSGVDDGLDDLQAVPHRARGAIPIPRSRALHLPI